MKSKKKVLLTICCAVVLVVASVMGTMAYLTSQDAVTNTFTVGDVKITLDETDADDSTADADRDKANAYKLMPGKSYVKDPIVHVASTSDDSWLFVKVVDEIVAIEDGTTVANQMTNNGWVLIDPANNVWAYNTIVKANDNITVFENFKIKDNISNDDLAKYKGKTITVKAYAVQADGFDTYSAAWTSAHTDFDF